MKPSLVEDLVCPSCGGKLAAIPDETEPGSAREILSGWLCCRHCPERYPIIGGVPRMLLGELRQILRKDYPDFFREPGVGGDPTFSGTVDPSAQLHTMRSFGYEWRHFSDIRPEGEANFRWYFEDFSLEALTEKTALDVGCGKGRHLYYVCRYARKAIGVDLSGAVDAAYQNTRELPNAHVVQADLLHLPFPKASFDFVYSLGVLHHLTSPEAGFRELLRYGRPGAYVLIYLYWSLQDAAYWKRWLLGLVTQLRRITTRLPFALLRIASWIVAVGAAAVFVLPHKWLRRARYRDLAEKLPLKAYANYPFRVLYQDQFDRLSAPIEHRFSLKEVTAWLSRAGLSDPNILGGAGWRAMGRIPLREDEGNEKFPGEATSRDARGACATQGMEQRERC